MVMLKVLGSDQNITVRFQVKNIYWLQNGKVA